MTNNTILIVDDSPTELKIVTNALRNRGYRIVTAIDGDEALQKASHEKPRLMLLDVVLPKKNGFQVCRQLKNSAETKDIKIILLTSKSQDSDRYWGMKQGADAYVTKPFEEAELLSSVGAFM
ncbi:response regulator [Telmatocola sphagniphila]|jgi:twitching motility two-component system response regulator PilH|uniref:Response regulator n=1 Tax=Telmatocola sphagniphila TaxID=1123043 RepID=A0A8E6EX47_9BACT|nr:response regulator [Telmatocola sphagniphila]QVL30881.1 response regulator [Telmatocola sphagniphila]